MINRVPWFRRASRAGRPRYQGKVSTPLLARLPTRLAKQCGRLARIGHVDFAIAVLWACGATLVGSRAIHHIAGINGFASCQQTVGQGGSTVVRQWTQGGVAREITFGQCAATAVLDQAVGSENDFTVVAAVVLGDTVAIDRHTAIVV
jgi:hypothetical protein